MLKEFNTKPGTVLACEILEAGELKADKKKGVCTYTHKGRGASITLLTFSVDQKQEAEVGDFIIKQSNDDIYLCKAEVFRSKYVVRGMVIR